MNCQRSGTSGSRAAAVSRPQAVAAMSQPGQETFGVRLHERRGARVHAATFASRRILPRSSRHDDTTTSSGAAGNHAHAQPSASLSGEPVLGQVRASACARRSPAAMVPIAGAERGRPCITPFMNRKTPNSFASNEYEGFVTRFAARGMCLPLAARTTNNPRKFAWKHL